jgi:predicted nucleic acid-binding protein
LSRIVIDASVTLSWCFDDESGNGESAILQMLGADMDATVPVIWPVEILNGCLSGERRGRIDADRTSRFLDELSRLPIEVADPPDYERLAAICRAGRAFRLTAYDASYLELAMREGLPLATLDAQLRAAARKAGVPTRIG